MTAVDPRQVARIGMFERYRSLDRSAWIDTGGRSMSPSIPAGSSLLVDFGRRPERLGEIIVFRRHDRLIAHRLVGRREAVDGVWLYAKGDGEAYLDPVLPEQEVLGVVRRVRFPDGRETSVESGRLAVTMLARISWSSGRIAGAGTRALRRLPAPTRIRGAALWGLLGLSRVPTRVVTVALPRLDRGPREERR